MSENKEKQKKPRRKRRGFTPEFKAGAESLQELRYIPAVPWEGLGSQRT